jgi:hypothetical protein
LFTVPLTGISNNFPEMNATVQFSIGQGGVTLVGCGNFSVPRFTQWGRNWNFGSGCF